jgi:hypothetical protein
MTIVLPARGLGYGVVDGWFEAGVGRVGGALVVVVGAVVVVLAGTGTGTGTGVGAEVAGESGGGVVVVPADGAEGVLTGWTGDVEAAPSCLPTIATATPAQPRSTSSATIKTVDLVCQDGWSSRPGISGG